MLYQLVVVETPDKKIVCPCSFPAGNRAGVPLIQKPDSTLSVFSGYSDKQPGKEERIPQINIHHWSCVAG